MTTFRKRKDVLSRRQRIHRDFIFMIPCFLLRPCLTFQQPAVEIVNTE